jgi:hypothetical protein
MVYFRETRVTGTNKAKCSCNYSESFDITHLTPGMSAMQEKAFT